MEKDVDFSEEMRRIGATKLSEQPLASSRPVHSQSSIEPVGFLAKDAKKDYSEREWYKAGLIKTMAKFKKRVPNATLNLHDHTISEAWEAINDFLAQCQSKEQLFVEVVHGRGHHSSDGVPILRGRVREWFTRTEQIQWFFEPSRNPGVTRLHMSKQRQNDQN